MLAFATCQNLLTDNFGYKELIFSLSNIINGETTLSSTNWQASFNVSYAFWLTFLPSESFGNAKIKPTYGEVAFTVF